MRFFLTVRPSVLLVLTVAAFGLLSAACREAPPPPRGSEPSAPSATAEESLSAQSPIPDDLQYEVINESTAGDARRSLDVRLSRKVEAEVLEALAIRLRDLATRRYARTYIVYYLPGMEVGAGGWATSHFNPDLDVRILGTPVSSESRPTTPGETVLGVWENNQPGFAGRYTIFETETGFTLERVFRDGSTRRETLVEQPSQVGRRFADPENRFGEFYLIRNESFELHDPEGMVFRARRITRDGSGSAF